jgi:uncharacterized protein (TIGR02466 family)
MFDIRSAYLFPKQVIVSDDLDYAQYRQQLIEYCYQEREKDPRGQHYSNVGGWQSDAFHVQKDPEFQFFQRRLIENVNECLTDHFMIDENIQITLLRLWINISGHHHYNVAHSHPMTMYSGVFYVKSADTLDAAAEFGDISFYQEAQAAMETVCRLPEYKKKTNIIDKVSFSPLEGRLLLFPATLMHGVSMNLTDSDRISISFDLIFDR